MVITMNLMELKECYECEMNPFVRERLLMMIWIGKGKTTYEVAELLDCPQSKVMYWKTRFEKEGIPGLRTRQKSGKPPKMSGDEVRVIREKLEAANAWQTKWVCELIREEAGVVYSERHVVRLLHQWGFELITPRKSHVGTASDEEKEQFKKKQKRFWTRSHQAIPQ